MPYLSRTARLLSVGLIALPFLAAVSTNVNAQSPSDFVGVTDAMLEDPAPGDWLTWRRTPDGWGYSPLDQIDRDNVGTLRMAWSRALTEGSQEGTSLAYGGVLYMPNPGDVIQAIDAATGDLVWEYRRDNPDDVTEYVGNLTTKKKLSERPPGQATFTSTSTPRLCKRRMRCWVTRCLSRSARYRPPRSW